MKQIQNISIGLTLLTGISAMPLVPQELTFISAYQYQIADEFETVSATSTQPLREELKLRENFYDSDGNGLISAAIFTDKTGNEIHYQIPDETYHLMGEVDGYRLNPKRFEFTSLLETFIEKAEAAIAFGAVTNGGNGGASSLTFSSPDVSGSNTLGVVQVFVQTDLTINSVTWNGVNATFIGRETNAAVNERIETWYILSPAAGVTNVVISRTGSTNSLQGRAAYYTGVKQSGQPDASVTKIQASGTTLTTTLTTVADNSWTVLTARNDIGNFAASTNTTFRSGLNQFHADNNANITPAGSYSMSVTLTDTESYSVMASFAPEPDVAASLTDDGQWWLIFE